MRRQSGDSCPCHPRREIGVLTPGLSLAVSRGEPLGSGGIARAATLLARRASCPRPALPVPGLPLLASGLAWRGAAWPSPAYLRAAAAARGWLRVFLLALGFQCCFLFVLQHMFTWFKGQIYQNGADS